MATIHEIDDIQSAARAAYANHSVRCQGVRLYKDAEHYVFALSGGGGFLLPAAAWETSVEVLEEKLSNIVELNRFIQEFRAVQ